MIGLAETSGSFLRFLDRWMSDLSTVELSDLLKQHPIQNTALLSVDVVNGFCKEGNLASERVASIVQPVVRLFKKAETAGMKHYILLQDTHPYDSKEFQIYPPHCMEGSKEAEAVTELQSLTFADRFLTIPKRTISPGLEIQFQNWLKENSQVCQFLIVGDCTDICIYLLSIFLKSWFVEQKRDSQIVVPVDCVNTFDIPVTKETKGAPLPHPGDFLHSLFLYHMQLNGIRIVREIQ